MIFDTLLTGRETNVLKYSGRRETCT